MSLEFTFKHSADDVFDLFCDPDFLVDRSMALGEISADAEIDEDDNGKVIITMRREVKRELPAFLAKLFNPQQVINLKEEWQQIGNNYVGKGEFTVEGQPVTVKTEMTLKASDKGSVFSIKYNAKAKIPMIGGKVEKFIESNCVEGTQKEMEFTASRLG
ncbi:MAG TPA: DUF2505 domain-containing protein [Pseudomonadales bacterium]